MPGSCVERGNGNFVESRFEYQRRASEETARRVVHRIVLFTAFEMNGSKQGRRFASRGSLWDGDPGMWLKPDDFLYSYDSTISRHATPPAEGRITLDVTASVSRLDGEWRRDEVRGLLTLRCQCTGSIVKRKTAVMGRGFCGWPRKPPEGKDRWGAAAGRRGALRRPRSAVCP